VAGYEVDEFGLPVGYRLLLVERGGSAAGIPVQWDSATSFPWEEPREGALVWIMDENSSAASTRTFDLVLRRGKASSSSFTIEKRADSHLLVRSGQKQMLQYNYGIVRQAEGENGSYDRAAYIHPVWTPGGKIVAGDFSPEHIHQRGLFLAYRSVRFGELETDFWGLGESSGRILPDRVRPAHVTGPVFAKLTIHNKGSVSGQTFLKEVWGVRIYQMPRKDLWLFDVLVRQIPVDPKSPDTLSPEPLTMELEKVLYGGMSYRGPSEWLHHSSQEVTRAVSQGIEFPGIRWLPPEVELDVLTSEGKSRADGNETAARWIDYTGPVGDGWGGLVMFSHPGNLRHPMSLRIHPELPYFSYALTQNAPLTVHSDQSLDQRFRILVHDGHPDRQRNERVGSDYVDPVEIVFEAAD
jgi:hypothetical protein